MTLQAPTKAVVAQHANGNWTVTYTCGCVVQATPNITTTIEPSCIHHGRQDTYSVNIPITCAYCERQARFARETTAGITYTCLRHIDSRKTETP